MASGSKTQLIIRKRSLSPIEQLSILVAAMIFALGVALLWLFDTTGPARATGGLSPVQNAVALSLLALALVATPLIFWLRQARAVHLSDDGVRIDYPLRTKSFPWPELMRVEGVGMGTVTFRPMSSPVNSIGGWFSISLEQARGIISDPRCPPVQLKEAFRRSIFQG